MIRVVHPDFLPIPDPGVKNAPNPGFRIRNIAFEQTIPSCNDLYFNCPTFLEIIISSYAIFLQLFFLAVLEN
jgi:hypothetical protein